MQRALVCEPLLLAPQHLALARRFQERVGISRLGPSGDWVGLMHSFTVSFDALFGDLLFLFFLLSFSGYGKALFAPTGIYAAISASSKDGSYGSISQHHLRCLRADYCSGT